jgi:hypothetical protein
MSIPETPEVEWANSRSGKTIKESLRTLRLFSKFTGKSPKELLEIQDEGLKSKDPDEQYRVANMLRQWIEKFQGRKSTKLNYISTVRAFFLYHRRPLPQDTTWVRRLKSDRERVEGKLTPEMFQTLIAASQGNPRTKSMLLTQLQSFSGTRELVIIGNSMGLRVAKELKEGANRIELFFPTGRKHSDKSWYTYIGKDSCAALREWFKERGWPDENNPYIWPSEKIQAKRSGKPQPLTESGVSQVFSRLAARLRLRPRIGHGKVSWARYGVSAGQIRDLALSLAQKARSMEPNEFGERVLEESSEYFAGHTIDELGYRKIHRLEPDFRRRQYEMIEPYLSPLSSPNGPMKSKIEELEGRLSEMQTDMITFDTDDLAKIWAAKTKEERQAIRERLFKS